jgi:4-hydroxy-3-methylbut-2-enyl diphosphate reductase
MEILVAEHAGFCEGVERAFRIAGETAREGKPVFMLGNLVHNKQVVERLNNMNVRTVAALNEIPAGTRGILLISAHGVAPEIYEEAKRLSLHVIDTTCPWVKKAQKIAKQLAEEARLVIIVGDRGHPEVKALLGWSGGRGVVVENGGDLDKLSLAPEMKIGVIAQTTQSKEHFDRMVALIKKKSGQVAEYDTICAATIKRQSAAIAIAKRVDLMLVIGDRLSANTKRLAELCAAAGSETHQIQTVEELDARWLSGKARVGITAGASTPEWIIREVLAKLKS